MKSAEAFAAQEAARTGHAVITTTHANSCKATYYRMVTLCTQKYDMGDKTLYNLVTEAFPIVLFVKKLEDNSRRVMEITECEILEDGARQLHTLYRYHVSETAVEDGKIKVRGEFQKVSTISASLQKAAAGEWDAAPPAGADRRWADGYRRWEGGNRLIVLILLAFAGMLAGIFLLLGMTPFEFAEDLTKSFASREAPISKRIGQLNHPREVRGIKRRCGKPRK